MNSLEKAARGGGEPDDIRNVDQLRHAIDHGGTGDKVVHADPAAVPLGTDAEAGGVSPTPGEIALDAAATVGRDNAHPKPGPGPLIYFGILVLVIAAVLIVMSLATSGTGP